MVEILYHVMERTAPYASALPCRIRPTLNLLRNHSVTGKNACRSERGTLNRHEKSSLHQTAMKTADEFLQVCNQKKKPITEFMSQFVCSED